MLWILSIEYVKFEGSSEHPSHRFVSHQNLCDLKSFLFLWIYILIRYHLGIYVRMYVSSEFNCRYLCRWQKRLAVKNERRVETTSDVSMTYFVFKVGQRQPKADSRKYKWWWLYSLHHHSKNIPDGRCPEIISNKRLVFVLSCLIETNTNFSQTYFIHSKRLFSHIVK